MQGSDGRGSDLTGPADGVRGGGHLARGGDHLARGGDHLVIRADFHARPREAVATDGDSLVAPIVLHPEGEARAPEPDLSAQREAARAEMERLRVEHRDLDDAIVALGRTVGDQLQLQRLKRRKLALRDRIRQLEDQLTPDIIA